MIELLSGEEIKRMVRKHWFVFAGQIFAIFLLAFAPLLVFLSLRSAGDLLGEEVKLKIAQSFENFPTMFFLILWFFFLWIGIFVLWTSYYLDVWVVTNKRIMNIRQQGFFAREVSTFRIDRVQDVTVTIEGLIPTLLDFGDITAHTAGDNRSFTMHSAPNPALVKEIMSEILETRLNSLDPLGVEVDGL